MGSECGKRNKVQKAGCNLPSIPIAVCRFAVGTPAILRCASRTTLVKPSNAKGPGGVREFSEEEGVFGSSFERLRCCKCALPKPSWANWRARITWACDISVGLRVLEQVSMSWVSTKSHLNDVLDEASRE